MKEIADCGLRIADSETRAVAAPKVLSGYRQSATQNPQSEIRNPQSVELHIEELVLHGFAPGDRYRISEAIEHELARLLIDRGVSPSLMQGNELDRLDVGSFDVAPNSNTRAIGCRVAQAIYGGLK